VKKIKEARKIKLKIERELLRTLCVNELRHAAGGSDQANEFTAASGGQVCCA